MTASLLRHRATCATLAALLAACGGAGDGMEAADSLGAVPAADSAEQPYRARVDEGLGASVAIVIDNSGSMWQTAPGDTRVKYVVAREAVEQMLRATEEIIRERPDFPVNVGIYRFSDAVAEVLPMQRYDRQKVRAALRT
ncbi:MAG TPA: VWA domain-containing protein, partial [Longimicrobium sp.]